MVQRTSNKVDFTGGTQVASYAQSGGGYVSPQQRRTVGDGGASANSALLQNILKDANGVLQTGLQTSREEAYLAGAAAAATGEAEASVESSFTTRDWAVAGYRDTTGKLKMADADADLPEDMKRLREEPPEKMAEYLAQRRAKLAPVLAGMSREQRTAAFGQMLLSDRAAIALHAKENMAFRIEQVVTSKQAEFSTYKASLDSALKSGNEGQYSAEVDKFTLGFIGGSIMNEGRFDNATKQKLATQAIDDALGSGNVLVYEKLQATEVPVDITKPDGPKRSVLSMLSMDNQRKLADSYRNAYNQTEGARDLDMHNAISFMKAEMSDGTYNDGVEGVYAMQKRILQSNKGNGAMATSLMDHFLSEKAKTHPDVPGIISAVMAGNFSKLDAMNVSPTEAIEVMDKEWAKKGVTAQQKVPLLINMLGTGNPAIASKLGGVVDGIMRSFAFSTDMTIENQATLKETLGYIETMKATGKDAALGQLYAGMPEDSAVRIQRLLAAGAVSNPKEAILNVREQEHREANMSPADKAATKLENSKALNTYLDEIKPMGQWQSFVANWTPFGATAAQAALSPKTSMWSSENANSDVMNKFVVDSQTALREQASAYALAHPTDTPETVVRMAEQATLRRTILVGSSPLIVPLGKTPNEYFGIAGSKLVASPEQLGRAIEAVTPKTDPSNRMTYTVHGDTVLVNEFNKDGAATGTSYTINRSEVAKEVARQQDSKKEATNAAYGVGIAVRVNGKTLTINGDNTAAMSNENMIAARKNLAKFEGFTKGVQQDVGKQLDSNGNPVMTTGMGISSTNSFYKEATEATTPEQHLEVFRKATNEAATNATRMTKALGLRGDSWQILMTELMYQSGPGNVAKLPEYQKFLSNRDPVEQVALLEKTPAYTMSQPSRQRHYRALIQQAVKGE